MSMQATIRLDADRHRDNVDPRIYGGFLEHLGRAVYEGVYDPGNEKSDSAGFRQDVLTALKELRMPVMRYPGGNFVSDYNWKDGIGPADQRRAKPDYAWQSVETNQFGTDEFLAWCRALGTEPMLAVNLGTGNARDAADLLEYCNLPRGTYWADRRPEEAPYGVKMWCLGNEMDGPWQAGHVPAEEYARRAQQAAKLMRGLDRTIETVLCGSSGNGMSTYMSWDRAVLEYCWDDVDYISAHRYSNNHRNDTRHFLAEGVEIEQILADYRGLLAYVRAVRKSKKEVFVSFDEWNVWYKNMEVNGGWERAPHLLEEVYNLEDALVCAQYLHAFIRNADLVKVACLAQIVNVIAPILTRSTGILIQSIYHPIRLLAEHAHGNSLCALVDCPTYEARESRVPYLDVAATLQGSRHTVSMVNRSNSESIQVQIRTSEAVSGQPIVEGIWGEDPKESNTWEAPDRLIVRSLEAELQDGEIRFIAPPLSYLCVRF